MGQAVLWHVQVYLAKHVADLIAFPCMNEPDLYLLNPTLLSLKMVQIVSGSLVAVGPMLVAAAEF